LKEKVKY